MDDMESESGNEGESDDTPFALASPSMQVK